MNDSELSGLETRLQALLADYRRLAEHNRLQDRELSELRASNAELKRRLRSILERIRALEVETA
ncbi:hypothetical protein [Abyssibacter sp.]|jgi:ABC-type phosphate transport system auxiliary subunit|uniref:hypothetical protein n=1 Tax=Abyssibacter sp. TaxID=2320200 RepID=UPI000C3EFE7B|nr:hypothetical protein [Abyssibacter sp.]MBB86391.1 hypothetical protein [Xanthomonadales bacterium]MCK5858695.1 hypothetical protein [Abyssibacter sp.]